MGPPAAASVGILVWVRVGAEAPNLWDQNFALVRFDRASSLADTPRAQQRNGTMTSLSTFEQALLHPVIARLAARLHPEEIWLFGSRAERRARPDSDYDLLAVLPDDTPEADLDPISAWSIVRGLGVPVDVVPCTRSEFEEEKHEIDTLARAAYLRGIRIYERTA